MYKLIFLLVILCSYTPHEIASQDQKVTVPTRRNGDFVIEEDTSRFPYLVSLRSDQTGEHFCGGSIVTSSHVLTAATCFCIGRYMRDEKDIIVVVGVARTDEQAYSSSQIYKTIRTTCHPEFNVITHDNDIAIINVEKPFVYSSFVGKIKVYTGKKVVNHTIPTNLAVMLPGWDEDHSHLTDENKYLQFMHCKTITSTNCRTALRTTITTQQFCTTTHDKRICLRSIGTPVVYQNRELIGVTSLAKCGTITLPVVHTNVMYHFRWIVNTIKNVNTPK